jgi:hypothetical protein
MCDLLLSMCLLLSGPHVNVIIRAFFTQCLALSVSVVENNIKRVDYVHQVCIALWKA